MLELRLAGLLKKLQFHSMTLEFHIQGGTKSKPLTNYQKLY